MLCECMSQVKMMKDLFLQYVEDKGLPKPARPNTLTWRWSSTTGPALVAAVHQFKADHHGARMSCVRRTKDFKSWSITVATDKVVSSPNSRSAYYTHPRDYPAAAVRLYMDLDIILKEGEQEDDIRHQVSSFISKVSQFIEEWMHEEVHVGYSLSNIIADHGCRHTANGWKSSWHIIFPDVVFKNLGALKIFLAKLKIFASEEPDLCRDGEPLWDQAVYGKQQALRAYMQTKGGDRQTVLWPFCYDEETGAFTSQLHTDASEFDFNFRKRDPFLPGLVQTYKMTQVVVEAAREAPAVDQDVGDFQFSHVWKMVENFWPQYNQWRQHKAKKHHQTTVNVDLPKAKDVKSYAVDNGHLYVEVKGNPVDTYCPYDNAHHHSQHPGKQTFTIDLTTMCVRENCHACRIQDDTKFTYVSLDTMRSGQINNLPYLKKLMRTNKQYGLLSTFANFNKENLIFRPGKEGGSFYIYCNKGGECSWNQDAGIWVNDKTSCENLLSSYADDFTNTCLRDLSVLWNVHAEYEKFAEQQKKFDAGLLDRQPSSPNYESVLKGIWTENRINGKNIQGVLQKWSACRSQVLTIQRHVQYWSTNDVVMDRNEHFVPMCNGCVFDCENGKMRRIRKDDFITSTTQAVLRLKDPGYHAVGDAWVDVTIDTDHENCQLAQKWFKEVAYNRLDLQLYLMQNTGNSFTSNLSERSFLVNQGNGSNGKGVWCRLMRAANSGQRYCTVPQNFFLIKSDQNVASEAPTSNSMLFMGRTCAAVEEMPTGVLSGYKIKTMSAGDSITARPLYGSPESFPVKAKIWLFTNQDPTFSPLDMALKNRLRVIDWKQKWSVHPQDDELQADVKMIQELEGKVDGFFSVSIEAWATFLKTGERYLPVPECVKETTHKYVYVF